MFAVYLAILAAILRRNLTSGRLIWASIASGIALGMIAYAAVVAPLNSIETFFMNSQGVLHILVIASIQEESAKLLCFWFAYGLLVSARAP